MEEANGEIQTGLKELDPVTAELLQTKLERLEALGWKTDQLQKDLSRMASLVGSRTLATLGVLGSATLTRSFKPRDEGSQLTPNLGSARTVALQAFKLAFCQSGQEVSQRFRDQEENQQLLAALRSSRLRDTVHRVAIEALVELKNNLQENKPPGLALFGWVRFHGMEWTPGAALIVCSRRAPPSPLPRLVCEAERLIALGLRRCRLCCVSRFGAFIRRGLCVCLLALWGFFSPGGAFRFFCFGGSAPSVVLLFLLAAAVVFVL